ncbi:hypothetical protein PENTCL1PPCAC_4206 [Pristionchus entomophagus]|uniref:Uncharacterized protein n=1 Tax=Pristionchus entomophagus TaxID=358040 RepID=A0AAV5SF90_9BILA|nr:hypothetical protein PENTCL1PPCAC_4206 [Pristionchus entomophagus]
MDSSVCSARSSQDRADHDSRRSQEIESVLSSTTHQTAAKRFVNMMLDRPMDALDEGAFHVNRLLKKRVSERSISWTRDANIISFHYLFLPKVLGLKKESAKKLLTFLLCSIVASMRV